MADAESLFIDYRTPVQRYLARIVGDRESAVDLTQEVFLRVTRSAVPSADPPQLRAWIFRIARNLALNHMRDRARTPELVQCDRAVEGHGETGVVVQQALDRLSGEDRDVFLLREMGGLSYDEIGAACDLTRDAVRSRLHRARLQLRQFLGSNIRSQRRTGIRLVSPS